MWNETKIVTVCSALSRLFEDDDEARAADAALTAEERNRAGLSVWARAEVTRRKADPRYSITVRHIGSRECPFRYDEIVGREDSERVLARARAATKLREVGAAPTPELLNEYSRVDPVWRRVLNEQTRTWIAEGVVDGAAEYHRLHALGFEEGGAASASSMLIHAALEVRRFQETPAETVKSGS